MASMRLVVLATLLWWSSTGTARAWTETRVEGMQAHLDVARDGSALVSLRIRIRVLGGWLSRFDLRGLDGELELDADKPPWLLSEAGEKFVPQVEQRAGGELRLTFPRRKTAPRRGRHEIGLLYRARLPLSAAPDGKAERASWTAPAWSVGLENVTIAIVAPAGSELAAPESLSERAAVSAQSSQHGALAFHSAQRVHLPRTVAWTLHLEMPHALGYAEAPASRADTTPSTLLAPHDTTPLWWALSLALLALLKLGGRRADRQGQPTMLIPWLGTLARSVAILACATAAGLVYDSNADLALALLVLVVTLALSRRGGQAVAPTKGTGPPASALAVVRARRQRLLTWFGPASWLDATTPAGLTLLLALWTVVTLSLGAGGDIEAWLAAGMLASALLLNGPRAQDGALPLNADWRSTDRYS